jgi:hypothetical protein
VPLCSFLNSGYAAPPYSAGAQAVLTLLVALPALVFLAAMLVSARPECCLRCLRGGRGGRDDKRLVGSLADAGGDGRCTAERRRVRNSCIFKRPRRLRRPC